MEVTGTMVESYLYTVSVTSQKQPPKVFYKKGILENFAKFTGKHLCQSPFFNQVEGQLWHRCFPVNFTKFPRTPFLQNTSVWMVLNSDLTKVFSKSVLVLRHIYWVWVAFSLIARINFLKDTSVAFGLHVLYITISLASEILTIGTTKIYSKRYWTKKLLSCFRVPCGNPNLVFSLGLQVEFDVLVGFMSIIGI